MKKFKKVKVKAYQTLTSLFFIVIATGTVFYHFAENWSWIDSLYFSVITLTTIGYGDMHPTTAFTKAFTVFYVFIGIGIIFGFINAMMK